jgi:hypothetical protein
MHPPTDCLTHLAQCSTIVFACRASTAAGKHSTLSQNRGVQAGSLLQGIRMPAVWVHHVVPLSLNSILLETPESGALSSLHDKTLQSTGMHAAWQAQPGWREACSIIRHPCCQRSLNQCSLTCCSFVLMGTGLARVQAQPGRREQEQPSLRRPALSKLQVFLSPQHRSARQPANSIISNQVITAIQHSREKPMLMISLLCSGNFCTGCRCPVSTGSISLPPANSMTCLILKGHAHLGKGNSWSAASSKPEAVAGLHQQTGEAESLALPEDLLVLLWQNRQLTLHLGILQNSWQPVCTVQGKQKLTTYLGHSARCICICQLDEVGALRSCAADSHSSCSQDKLLPSTQASLRAFTGCLCRCMAASLPETLRL